jgi:hypothetical protein
MPEQRSEIRKWRTAIYVDRLETVCGVRRAVVTVAGVDLIRGANSVLLADLPPNAEPGKVFFAYVNLAAQDAEDVGIERIEPQWGDTSPIYFEDGTCL